MLRARPSSGSKAWAKRAVPSRRSLPQPLKGPSPRASTADRLPSGSTTCFLAGPKPEPARSLLLFVRPFHPPRARSSCTLAPPRARICFREGYRDRRLGLLVEIPCWPVPALALQNEEGAKEFEMRREESPERGETVASSDPKGGNESMHRPQPVEDRTGRRPRSARVVFDTHLRNRRAGNTGWSRRTAEGRVWKREDRERAQTAARAAHFWSALPSDQIANRIKTYRVCVSYPRPRTPCPPPPPNTHRPPAASQT